jgi:putative transposase
MPSRNRVKEYEEGYYHLYNRGVNKQIVFRDQEDYAVFLNLLKRYLDDRPVKDNKGREYEWLHDRLELLAFCLMPNHWHLLIYQHDKEAMTRLMRGVATSYTTYFNKKYKRIGPLFQERFKASRIDRDDYLQHISRYIHLNPDDYKNWEFSSLPYYLRAKNAGWVRPVRILEIFEGSNYEQFVTDYEDHKKMLDTVSAYLADN